MTKKINADAFWSQSPNQLSGLGDRVTSLPLFLDDRVPSSELLDAQRFLVREKKPKFSLMAVIKKRFSRGFMYCCQ